ncbi:SWIM zinc finger family protein [Halalkalicoccus salilacus]|uniref:SWIM zinc finger family protein n=1 Tax=Halalkalicoccus TaxID=332246 RepID=UPI002F96C7B5
MVETDPLLGAFHSEECPRAPTRELVCFSPQTMCTNAIDTLEFDASTSKRAQYEAFDFELTAPGLVTVRNESHENAAEHSYRVNVENSVPVACECPADMYHDGACKHRVAVAIREPVLEAATEYETDQEPAVIPDGGTTTERTVPCEQRAESRPADCDCLPTFEELPCWPCYREGFCTPNPAADTED